MRFKKLYKFIEIIIIILFFNSFIKAVEDAGTYNQLGISEAQNKHYELAIKSFSMALQIEKNNPEIYINLADTCLKYVHNIILKKDSLLQIEKYLKMANACLKMGGYKLKIYEIKGENELLCPLDSKILKEKICKLKADALSLKNKVNFKMGKNIIKKPLISKKDADIKKPISVKNSKKKKEQQILKINEINETSKEKNKQHEYHFKALIQSNKKLLKQNVEYQDIVISLKEKLLHQENDYEKKIKSFKILYQQENKRAEAAINKLQTQSQDKKDIHHNQKYKLQSNLQKMSNQLQLKIHNMEVELNNQKTAYEEKIAGLENNLEYRSNQFIQKYNTLQENIKSQKVFYNQQLMEKDKQIKQKNDICQDTVKKLQVQLNEKNDSQQSHIVELKNNAHQMTNKYQGVIISLKDKIKSQENYLKKSEKQYARENKKKESKINELKKKIKEIKKENKDIIASAEDKLKNYNSNNKNYKKIAELNKNLFQENLQYQVTIINLNKNLEKNKKKEDFLQKYNTELEQDVQLLKKDNRKYSSQIEKLEDKLKNKEHFYIEELTKKDKELKKINSSNEKKIKELKKNTHNKIYVLERKDKQSKNEISKYKKKIIKLSSNIKSKEKMLNKIKEDEINTKKKYKKMIKLEKSYKHIINDLKKEIQKSKKEKETFSFKINKLKQDNKQIKFDLRKYEKRERIIIQKDSNNKDKIKSTEVLVLKQNKDIEILNNNLDLISERIKNKDKQIINLKNQLTNTISLNKQMKNQIKELTTISLQKAKIQRRMILQNDEKDNKIKQLNNKISFYNKQLQKERFYNNKLTRIISMKELIKKNKDKQKELKENEDINVIEKKEMFLLKTSGFNRIFKIPVLCYHSFDNENKYSISQAQFKKQMKYLHKNNYNVISIDKLIFHIENKIPFSKKVCVLTFDDGYSSVYKVAFPVLKKYNFPATLFLYTNGFIDIYPAALTWSQIREMAKYNITVQSHSHTHPWLHKRKKGESYKRYLKRVKWELETPKCLLENKLNISVDYFAFPFGGYNKDIIKLAKEAGYKALFNVDMGLPKITDNQYNLKRITISANYNLKIFKKLITKGTF